MQYTIYSIGNSEFLYQVMNGMARIFDYTSGGLASFIAIASLLMLMGGLLGKIFNDKATPIKDWVFGLIFFFVLAGPYAEADVEIVSVRTGAVYTVDDVPLFAAIGGYITTSLTHLLSEEFEQSFASVSPSSNGLQPLRALQAAQHLGLSTLHIPGAPDDYDPIGSMNNYISTCFMAQRNLSADNQDIDTKLRAAYMSEGWSAVYVATNTLKTSVSLGSPYSRMGCKDAWKAINELFITTDYFKKAVDAHNKASGVEGDMITEGFNSYLVAGDPATAAANQYVISQAILLNNMIQKNAKINGNGTYDNIDVAKFEAKQTRLYQMSSERSMWREMSVGMVSVLESFVFFVAPLVAVILVMGGMGLKAMVGYFGLVVWVNFWPVSMQFVNLYTEMAIEGKFYGLEGSASTYGLFDESMMTIESSIAFASQLTAMIPMLTLFILHRGVHTMMGVASQTAPNTFNGAKASQSAQTTGEAGSYRYQNQTMEVTGNQASGIKFQETSRAGSYYGMRNLTAGMQSIGGVGSDVSAQADKVSRKSVNLATSHTDLAKIGEQSLKTDASGQTLAHNTNHSYAKGALIAQAAGDIQGINESSIQTAAYNLSANAKAGSNVSAGAGFTYKDLINQLATQGITLEDKEAAKLEEAFQKTESIMENWSNTDSFTDNAETADAYAKLKTADSIYQESLSDMHGAVVNNSRRSVTSSNVDLEQASASALMNTQDKAKNAISAAVNNLSDENVGFLLRDLNADGVKYDKAGNIDMSIGEQRELLKNMIYDKQAEEADRMRDDSDTSTRKDIEGLAAISTPLNMLHDMQKRTSTVDPKASFIEQNKSKMLEQSQELEAIGQFYKGMGIEIGSGNLIKVGETQEDNAKMMKEKINGISPIASNETGIKLGEDLHAEPAKVISTDVNDTDANRNSGLVTTAQSNDWESKAGEGKGTLTKAEEQIAKNEADVKGYIEKLNEKAHKVSGLFNQLDGHLGNAAVAAAHIVDTLGGEAGYDERLAQVGALKNSGYSETMRRGFELLANNESDNVNKILKDGFSDNATKEQRADAEAIVFAQGQEGREIFEMTNAMYQSKFRDGEGSEFIGDGVDTGEWKRINDNLNALSDRDVDGDGQISANERGTVNSILHSENGGNIIPSLAKEEFFSDGVASHHIESSYAGFNNGFDGKTPPIGRKWTEITSISDNIRQRELSIAKNAGVEYNQGARPAYSEPGEAYLADRSAVSLLARDQISDDSHTQRSLSHALGYSHSGSPRSHHSDLRPNADTSFKGTPDEARHTIGQLEIAQGIAVEKGYHREANNIYSGMERIRQDVGFNSEPNKYDPKPKEPEAPKQEK